MLILVHDLKPPLICVLSYLEALPLLYSSTSFCFDYIGIFGSFQKLYKDEGLPYMELDPQPNQVFLDGDKSDWICNYVETMDKLSEVKIHATILVDPDEPYRHFYKYNSLYGKPVSQVEVEAWVYPILECTEASVQIFYHIGDIRKRHSIFHITSGAGQIIRTRSLTHHMRENGELEFASDSESGTNQIFETESLP